MIPEKPRTAYYPAIGPDRVRVLEAEMNPGTPRPWPAIWPRNAYDVSTLWRPEQRRRYEAKLARLARRVAGGR